MKDLKVFVKVDVTKELPMVDGQYFVWRPTRLDEQNVAVAEFGGCEYLNIKESKFWLTAITHWAKEIDLSDLMIGFATQYYADIRKAIECNSFAVPRKEELLKKFLEEKGYITIE